jgi:hypothetical protein
MPKVFVQKVGASPLTRPFRQTWEDYGDIAIDGAQARLDAAQGVARTRLDRTPLARDVVKPAVVWH